MSYKTRSTRDRSIPPTLQRWVSMKSSISQLTFFYFVMYVTLAKVFVSTIQTVVLTADVFHLFTKNYAIKRYARIISAPGLDPLRSLVIYSWSTRVFAIKIIQPIIPSNLKKAKFIRASLGLCLRWANRRNSVRGLHITSIIFEIHQIRAHLIGLQKICFQKSKIKIKNR